MDEVTPAAVVTASWLGRTVPLHATSTGKALLAFLPSERVRRVLSTALAGFTATTITDRAALGAELAATRARGYGVCAGELEASLYGVSAPVLDRAGRPLAVLSIWGPRDRIPADRFTELGAIVVRAAALVAAATVVARIAVKPSPMSAANRTPPSAHCLLYTSPSPRDS